MHEYPTAARSGPRLARLPALLPLLLLSLLSASVVQAENTAGSDVPALSESFVVELYETGDLEAAQRIAGQAQSRAERTGSPRDRALAASMQAAAHAFAGEAEAAEGYYRTARQVYAALGDLAGEGLALQGIADLERARGRAHVAVRHQEEASALYARAGEPFGRAAVEAALGHLAAAAGDTAGAAAHLREAAGLYRQAGKPEGVGLSLLALANLRTGTEAAEARADLAAAQAAFLEADSIGGRASVALQLSRLEIAAGNRPEAADQLETALDLFRRAGDPRGEAEGMILVGQLGRHAGAYEASLGAFDDAVMLYRAAGDAEGVASALVHRADLQVRTDPEAALEDYDLAAQLFAEMGMTAEETYCREAMTVVKLLRSH